MCFFESGYHYFSNCVEMWKKFFVIENVLWKRSFQAGKGVLGYKLCYASLLLLKPKPCPINCITSSKGDLYRGASMESQQVTSLPQAINKAFTVSWHLLEPIVHNLIFFPLLISQRKQRNNLQKPDTGQTVSCWHHSGLESYCPFEMLNKPVGCWYNLKGSGRGRSKTRCSAVECTEGNQILQPIFKFLKRGTKPTDLTLINWSH